MLVNVNAQQPSLMQRNNSKLTRRRISRRFLSIDCNSLKSGRVSASTLTSFGVSTKSSALSAPPLGTSQFEGVAIVDGVYCGKLEGKWQGLCPSMCTRCAGLRLSRTPWCSQRSHFTQYRTTFANRDTYKQLANLQTHFELTFLLSEPTSTRAPILKSKT